ncbi:MAG: OmpH family outer membrane protein [Bacteroidales bacterium]|jgi:outer membrane protein|nr:OmpH family outer membrane protein [Bacteroidales bacterium]
MKKCILIFALVLGLSMTASAQQRSGHVSFQEIVYLTSDMDSATVVLEKYGKELNDMFTSMQQEYQNKLADYQALSANWTQTVLEAKVRELQDAESRLQSFQQSAYQDMQNKQNQLFAPIYKKVSDAIQKVAKANGLVYVFDTSAQGLLFVDEVASMDLTVPLKNELNIPLDKALPTQQMQQAQ